MDIADPDDDNVKEGILEDGITLSPGGIHTTGYTSHWTIPSDADLGTYTITVALKNTSTTFDTEYQIDSFQVTSNPMARVNSGTVEHDEYLRGDSVAVSVEVENTGDVTLSDLQINVDIADPDDVNVKETILEDGITLSSGETYATGYTSYWTIPADADLGTYTITVALKNDTTTFDTEYQLDSFQVTAEETPNLSAHPVYHDFGSLDVGETANYDFYIENTGGGTLSWEVTESLSWISVTPTSGTTTTETDTITVSVDTSELTPGQHHDGYIHITSNGGDEDIYIELDTNAENHPPNKPNTPSGDSAGTVDELLTFSTSATDPDGDNIKYGWDWNGDSMVDVWTGYYSSDSTASKSHSWADAGTYTVKVKAKDEHGAESGWSNTKQVNIEESYVDIAVFSDEIAFSPPNPVEGQPTIVSIPIHNLGTVHSEVVHIGFWVNTMVVQNSIDIRYIEENAAKLLYDGIAAGDTVTVSFKWNATSICNDENHDLEFRVSTDEDNNDDNDVAFCQSPVDTSSSFNICRDGYHFGNTEFTDSVKISIDTYAKSLLDDINCPSWLESIILEQIEQVGKKIIGFCYGMSATSILYNKNIIPSPENEVTFHLEIDNPTVRENIIQYQILQIVDYIFYDSQNDNNKEECARSVFEKIEEGAPIILGYQNEPPGHAVVAYNTFEVNEDIGHVVCYDNNEPGVSRIMVFNFTENTIYWLHDAEERYRDFYALAPVSVYSAKIDLWLQNSIQQYINNFVPHLYDGVKKLVSFNCPVNVTITDAYGRVINEMLNEIPNATYRKIGEGKYFYLPMNMNYSIFIEGYGSGDFTVTQITPITNKTASVNSIVNVSLSNQTEGSINLGVGDTNYCLNMDYDGDNMTDELLFPSTNETIEVNENPIASFEYFPSNPVAHKDIAFNATDSYDPDGTLVNWTWDFGDGNMSYEPHPTHHYPDAGVYNITLTVTDNNGATNYTTKQIVVQSAGPLSSVYVDDDYNSSTNGWGYDHFDRIQDAVDAVEENGTVHVKNGIYYENVAINKSITLMGNNRSTTIIDGGGSGDVINVSADSVSISLLTVRNSGAEWYDAGIKIKWGQNCRIENIILINNSWDGIGVYHSNNTIITNNIFINNAYGIELYYCNNSTIGYNNLKDHIAGIDLHSSSNANITSNIVTNSEYGAISLRSSSDCIITGNTMVKNGITVRGDLVSWTTHTIDTSNTINSKPVVYWKNVNGGTIPTGAGQIILANCTNVRIEDQEVNNGTAGIELGFLTNCTITNNSVSNNTYGIRLSSSSGCTIIDNKVNKNRLDSIYLESSTSCSLINNIINDSGYGIWLDGSHANTFIGNIISNNYYGIHSSYSNNNNVTSNNASNNRDGIFLFHSNNVIIVNNTISDNNHVGIFLDCSGNCTIQYNTISDNYNHGIFNDNSSSEYATDAPYNWWDTSAGPYQPDLNPNGTGDNVSDNVVFEPWLTAPVKGFKEATLEKGEQEIDATGEADISVTVNATQNNSIRIISYEGPPVNESDVVKSVGKNVEVEVENTSNVKWPINLKIYYTQADIDKRSLTENQLMGIYFYNETSETWELYNDTGVNTTDITKSGKQYAGYAWANAWHLTKLTVAGDNQPPAITDVAATPETQQQGGMVNITCTVIDNIGVDTVMANITYPDSSTSSLMMSKVAGTDTYYYETTYSMAGDYQFHVWANDSKDNMNTSTEQTFTISLPQYTLSTSVDPSGSGSISLSPSDGTYDEGTLVTVTANPSSGYEFDHWNGDGTGSTTSIDITMDSDKTVTAHFTEIVERYTLTTSVDPSGGGTVSLSPSGGTYDEGTTVTVTASASSGYVFDHWSGDAGGSSTSIDVTMNNDKSIVAHFTAVNQPPSVSLASPTDGSIVNGTVTVSGTASDSDGNVQSVEVRIDDGSWQAAIGTESWTYSWDTTDVNNGNHTIKARSYDGEDYSDVASVNIKVFNNHPPSVSITSPEDGATVNGTVVVNGTASDEDGGEPALNDTFNNRVEVRIGDGNWMTAIEDWMHVSNTTVTAWTYTWNTTEMKDGDYTVDVRAYDGINYSNIESITVTIDNEKEGVVTRLASSSCCCSPLPSSP